MKDKFKEYMKDIQGMDRIELILDLYKEDKITKDQALVLIVNDKQIKEEPQIHWKSSIGSTITNTPYVYPTTTVTTPYVHTTPTTNPYTTTYSDSGTIS
jgi:hypothetical protein